MSKKILVLYGVSGFLGHKVIGENYAALLKAHGHEVHLGDAFAIDGKTVIKGGEKVYFWWLKTTPWFWRFLYLRWTNLPGAHWFKRKFFPSLYKKTARFVLDLKPDIVIAAHVVASAVVSRLKEQNLYRGRLISVFSDWHMQDFWVYPGIDKYLIETQEQREVLIKKGIDHRNIHITGMLLSPAFYKLPSKDEAKKNLGIAEDKKIIIVMGGGMGWQIEKIIETLSLVEGNTQSVIITGSAPRAVEINNLIIEKFPGAEDKFKVLGFIEPSSYFAAADLLISKPGGLTTSQAFLSKLPMLVVSPLPGQEEENIKYLIKQKAILLENNSSLSEQITELIKDDKKLDEAAENAYKLAPKNAPNSILEIINKEL